MLKKCKFSNTCWISSILAQKQALQVCFFWFLVFDASDEKSEFPQKNSNYVKTLVKRSASIGANATIICGKTIGKYALIGAGSVVTTDIPNFALAVGNPARIIGWVNEKGLKIAFEADGKSSCGNFYHDDNKIIRIKKN